jgi:uncharacterized tellurite resistance protein B-like protein
MFDKIVAYLERRIENNAINPDPFERRQVAVAALLIEMSRLDGHYDAAEQGTVIRLLREMLHLPPEQARNLLGLAEVRQANTYDDWVFCQAIKKGFTPAECLEIVTRLWQVALLDGQLHRMESLMIDRVTLELGIGAEQSAAAREAAKSLT